MSCKVRIDAPHGIVEIEGDAEFVASFYEKLAPLVDRAHFGTAVRIEDLTLPQNENGISEEEAETGSQAKGKKKRKTSQRPPSGSSCRDRILQLKSSGFFKSKQSASAIVTGLATNGFTHTLPQVGAALTPMFEKGEIQRTKDGGGSWKYFWDRG
jgi:hypothetical protein